MPGSGSTCKPHLGKQLFPLGSQAKPPANPRPMFFRRVAAGTFYFHFGIQRTDGILEADNDINTGFSPRPHPGIFCQGPMHSLQGVGYGIWGMSPSYRGTDEIPAGLRIANWRQMPRSLSTQSYDSDPQNIMFEGGEVPEQLGLCTNGAASQPGLPHVRAQPLGGAAEEDRGTLRLACFRTVWGLQNLVHASDAKPQIRFACPYTTPSENSAHLSSVYSRIHNNLFSIINSSPSSNKRNRFLEIVESNIFFTNQIWAANKINCWNQKSFSESTIFFLST